MKKILVANRGEIALRIIRSIKEMGIQTVAVYSEVDRDSPHVKAADEAVLLGPAPSKDSYLRGDKIIEICKQLQVDGIHPGFGFLSENSEFALAVEAAGITFIGPSAHAMEIMGSKLAAKEAVAKYNTPLVPGTEEAITDIELAKKRAVEIGFPILIKASAGGGGKGMRIVENVEEFEEQMNRAISEAVSAFGDGAVFIEKYVLGPRHIEIQVLADKHGNIVYLFERECSIQRRHQKVIEEAPSAVLTPELRKKMGEDAVNVARSCNYVGAGTVEFLLDAHRNYYFLEMNTRLQVEHPVSELITGIDLVKEQVKVARGEELSFKQEDLKILGHAIELRVYAEDPQNNFLPDIGKLEIYKKPEGPGVRIDDGFEEGMQIPIYYDPMISKLIVHAENREAAIGRMKRAIKEYHIKGVKNTLSFGSYVMNHPAFVSGDFDTGFVKDHFKASDLNLQDEKEMQIAAQLAAHIYLSQAKQSENSAKEGIAESKWKKNRTIY
ncbi:MAG: acetyl-CoA carboxylase biotin carboxylase subunit [Chitinophagales bacterium]|nr:acetyl-CoA carboxylase biotin carboxylase subunit [Chitinophagales bacterium]